MNFEIVTIVIPCPFCGETHTVDVFESDYLDWTEGKLAQDAFPYLDATQREQLISHVCPICQASLFGTSEEEETEDVYACEVESLGGNWW